MICRISLFVVVITTLACQKNTKIISRVSQLPFYHDATFTPLWNKPDSLHQIKDFSFTNQDGEIVNHETFAGRIYVVDFFFTSCPGICPRMTANMGVLQDAFLEDDEILLLSHSVTPKRDSVSVLKNYAEAKGVISNKWHLVTGKQKDIYEVGRKSYYVEEDLGLEKSDDEFLHTENFVLVDKNKHIRGIYNGLNKGAISQLIADINTLKREG